jgi:two-component system chemotaxis response regulator CheY
MSIRAVVVDDSTLTRKLIQKLLAGAGCEIVGSASDGNQALAKCKELDPDLLTLDLVMPNVNGDEVLEEIKRECPRTKVIVVSSVAMHNKVVECIKKGADNYLLKPFDHEKIVEVVKGLFPSQFEESEGAEIDLESE